MNTYARLFISFCFVALTAATPAATIWDNGGPDFTDALASDPGTMPLPSQAGDDFTVGTTATANQIQWWGAYSPSDTPTQPDNFTIRFFNIVAGVPAIVPFASYSIGEVVGVDTGSNLTAIDLDVYSFTAAIPATLLAPGSYLLSIVNDTTADTDDNWFWAFSNITTGNSQFRFNDGEAWMTSGFGELAFRIDGNAAAVPEGGTSAVLFGFALVGIIVAQRRWRLAR